MPKSPKYNEIACPKCKEPIAIDAQICPHCRTEFDPADVESRVKGQRKAVAIGCGVILAVIVGLAALGSSGDEASDKSSSDNVATADENPEPGSADPAVKDAAIGFYRSLFAGMGACDKAASKTADVANGLETGSTTIYDAYSAATAQVAACKASWHELDGIEIPSVLAGPARDAAEKAREICSNTALTKQMGAETMQEVFDGNMKPSKIEEMRQHAEAAQAGVLACVAGATDVAMRAGVNLEDLPKFE